MGFPILSQSLCGCSLRTGSRVIAWLSLLSAVMNIVLGVVDMVDVRDMEGELGDDFKMLLTGLHWIAIIFASMMLFATLALLMGIDRLQPTYMMPWLFMKTFSVILSLSMNIYILARIQISAVPIINVIDQVLSTYMLLIVYSYQRTLKEEARNYT